MIAITKKKKQNKALSYLRLALREHWYKTLCLSGADCPERQLSVCMFLTG